MPHIVCPACSAALPLDPARVPPSTIRVRCRCGHSFLADGQALIEMSRHTSQAHSPGAQASPPPLRPLEAARDAPMPFAVDLESAHVAARACRLLLMIGVLFEVVTALCGFMLLSLSAAKSSRYLPSAPRIAVVLAIGLATAAWAYLAFERRTAAGAAAPSRSAVWLLASPVWPSRGLAVFRDLGAVGEGTLLRTGLLRRLFIAAVTVFDVNVLWAAVVVAVHPPLTSGGVGFESLLSLLNAIVMGLTAVVVPRIANADESRNRALQALQPSPARPEPAAPASVTPTPSPPAVPVTSASPKAAPCPIPLPAEPLTTAAAPPHVPRSAPGAESAPCAGCGTRVDDRALVCPHCGISLRVDLIVGQPPNDKDTYALAKAVGALGPPAPELSEARRIIGSNERLLLRGVSREFAHSTGALISRYGCTFVIRPVAGGHSAALGVLRRKPVLAGGALAVVAAVAILVGIKVRTLDPEEIARRARPSTATVVCGAQMGSGFFVTPELLVTNAHVLCKSGKPRITLASGVELAGRVRTTDERLDLAVVDVPGAGAKPLVVGDASTLVEGERIMIIGAPRGLGFSVHGGAVSNVRRHRLGIAYLQLDGSINPGNSGGPVLDTRGHVVGIVTMMVPGAQGLGFALPANYLYWGDKAVAPELARSPSKRWVEMMESIEREDADARLRSPRR